MKLSGTTQLSSPMRSCRQCNLSGRVRVTCLVIVLGAMIGGILGCRTTAVETRDTVTPPTEVLAVFVQEDASDLARRFQWSTLPELEALAREEGLELRVIEASQGAPEEVKITPLVVYASHRGPATFQGRYLNQDRLLNFLKTFRRVSQGRDPVEHRDLFVWRHGRATIAAPIKMTPLSGSAPQPVTDVPGVSLVAEARAALALGMAPFEKVEQVALGRSDRSFYVDFYPHRSADDQLFVTVAVFSQFHCKKPVFTNQSAPVQGAWSDRREVWQQAGQLAVAEIERVLADSSVGDGFDTVDTSVPVVSWQELGLAAEDFPRAIGGAESGQGAELGPLWAMAAPATGDDSRILFRFAPPLDHYSGQVEQSTGLLEFTNSEFSAGVGAIVVDASTVTMGHPDLDDAIRDSDMLHVAQFPEAFYRIDSFQCEPLRYGSLSRAQLSGVFEMKGVTQELQVQAQIEPVVDEQGAPQLILSGAFQIRLLELYGIEGPDGPEVPRDTLLFDFWFPFSEGAGPPVAVP